MEWSERMNAAIGYIENNLENEIDFNTAAQKACCSTFHFQRMFSVVIGIAPGEYVRRRRLTLAARDLVSSGSRVIDIALKYGYDSPVSFSRAFRNLHGVTPQVARSGGVPLAAVPRICFSVILVGGMDMDYKIIEKPAFTTVGRGKKFSTSHGQNFIKIPQFWQEFMKSPDFAALLELGGKKPGLVTGGECLGLCIAGENNSWEPFTYAICVETSTKNHAGFEVYPVPAANWAVFDCKLTNIQEVTKRIFNEWFPSTGFEHDFRPEIEVYFPEDARTREMPCHIWIPIIRKKG
jgi:AraC family transcriptional regulator